VLPRIPASARALVLHHRGAGHTPVMSSATNGVFTELTAAALAIPHLIATEVELADSAYTGHIRREPNGGRQQHARHRALRAQRL
jgi:phosphoserine phosphatase